MEQLEEAVWLVFTAGLDLCALAKVWKVELVGVCDPNDVVEEAGVHKDSDTMITFRDANISDFQKSVERQGVIFTAWMLMLTHLVTVHPSWPSWNTVLTGMHPNSVTVLMYFPVGSDMKMNVSATRGG